MSAAEDTFKNMSMIRTCHAKECAYNRDQACHAIAITVGDTINPHCDTFVNNGYHVKNVDVFAGVGACKVARCRYNEDLECHAANIDVGIAPDKTIKCLSYRE